MVRCKTLLEFIKESQRFFIQRQDETWCEKVDIESLDEVMNRDKLFLICSTNTNTSQTDEKVWYRGGPPLTSIPMPILDTERAWGSNCDSCAGFCCGHYVSPADNFKWVQENGTGSCVQPPREVISDFIKHGGEVMDEEVKSLAQKTALSESDVRLWVDHLKHIQMRRKQGARKAKEKRRSQKGENNKGIA